MPALGHAGVWVRILFISAGHPAHDLRFLKALRSDGDQVYYLPLSESFPDPCRVVLGQNQHVVPDDPSASAALASSLTGRLPDLSPDVTLAGPLHTGTYLAALAGCAPMVAMSWASDLLLVPQFPDRRAPIAKSLSGAAAFFYDSPAVAEAAIAQGHPLPAWRIEVPWGIDLGNSESTRRPQSPRTNSLRRQLGWDQCDVVLSCRNWEPVYDVPTALRAFSLAHQQAPNLRLILAGGGSQHDDVIRIIEKAGLQSVVHVPGSLPPAALLDFYEEADIYLSASCCDGVSISLLDALWRGLLPVVTDIPGNRPWVEPGSSGWRFPIACADVAAAQLVEAAAIDPGEKEQILHHNRLQIREHGNWATNSTKILQLLRDVARHGGENRSPRP